MDVNILVLLNLVLMPAIGIIAFIVKKLYLKVDMTVSRHEIRLLIDDKLKPIEVLLKVMEHRLSLIEKEQHLILTEIRKNGRDN